MSSFIDYEDPAEVAKADADLQMISAPSSTSNSPASRDRRKLIDGKVEQLRVRLQLAHYKVKTDQTRTPFSHLKSPVRCIPSPELPIVRFAETGPYQCPANDEVREDYVAHRRAGVTAQVKLDIRPLNTIPVPRILPTAYSARYMTEAPLATTQHIPPSPPASNGNNSDPRHHNSRGDTPTPKAHRISHAHPMPKTPAQLSSPPTSDGESEDGVPVSSWPTFKTPATTPGRTLTSSVVKGEAANGLLQLMRAASSAQEGSPLKAMLNASSETR